ncbi:MAG: methionyl-tRNA formyltransferase [Actinomycetota bacterium]|nr:methionyl-tRNA formyltransferase [Actinomycetota bacterium]MDK1037606.1 methionyl-tRNA formyltransferase [Actinomycetota bacterium]MDK1102287.1 methionyl-tRNA formyltransferase [Actinomycetota bacterium]MDK1290876.1 methionyl-tRNA formyltransferase [Actinomycetota bacterium]
MGGVFLGTPSAAIPSLAALADVEDVDLVITQPDRRAGRGGAITSPPVKIAAEQFGFPIVQPESTEELNTLLTSGGFSFGLIVAFGRILTPTMLAAVPYGFLNVHFSLLPRWRGAAPVERAIEAGDTVTGVTLMKIDEGLDTGPVLAEVATPIGPLETGGSLTARLSFLGASLIDVAMPEYLNNRRRPVPQITSGVTVARRLTKGNAQLASNLTSQEAERAVRAFQPRPVAWLNTSDGALRVHSASISEAEGACGEIAAHGGRVTAGFEGGALQLGVVQPAGKQRLDATSWMHGRRGEPVPFD